MSKNITASVANTADEKIRLKVGEPLVNQYGRQVAEPRWATGIAIEAVYVGRKWFVVRFDSAWQTQQGTRTGTYYTAFEIANDMDAREILSICEKLGVEPPAAIEAVEA